MFGLCTGYSVCLFLFFLLFIWVFTPLKTDTDLYCSFTVASMAWIIRYMELKKHLYTANIQQPVVVYLWWPRPGCLFKLVYLHITACQPIGSMKHAYSCHPDCVTIKSTLLQVNKSFGLIHETEKARALVMDAWQWTAPVSNERLMGRKLMLHWKD